MGRMVVAAVLLTLGACGGDEQADPCPRAVIDWEGGPSPYRTEQEAVEGFVDAFPELNRLEGLAVGDGRMSWLEGEFGTYELATFGDGSMAVVEAEWCFPDTED